LNYIGPQKRSGFALWKKGNATARRKTAAAEQFDSSGDQPRKGDRSGGSGEEGTKIADVDFRVSVEDKQLARKIHVISRTARWREIEEAALALAAPFIADNSQLTRALGRKYEAISTDATLGDIENL
jgi:hypothetical protein